MALLHAQTQRLDATSHRLFYRALHATPWSARELIGSGKTACTEEQLERAWISASMGYYTEQAGLVTAAELVSQTEDFALRMALSTAVTDEARHADAFLTYAVARGGDVADVADADYVGELHTVLSAATYLEKCFLHTMFEGFAADEFILLQRVFAGDPLSEIIRHVRADEIRHVAMGMDYLRRSHADPRHRSQWQEQSAEWERRGLEVMNIAAGARAMAAVLDHPEFPAERIERWLMRRHRTRMQTAGMPIPAVPAREDAEGR